MRRFLGAALIWLCATPLWADARITVLVDVLKLDEAAVILRDEGLAYGAQLNTEMLEGQGGAAFQQQLGALYDAQRMVETVRRALEETLESDAVEEVIGFYATDLGQKIVTLENSARQAIQEDDVEQAARSSYAARDGTDDPRIAQLEALVAAGDLVNRNVTSAMNANYQFMRGLAEGGALGMTDEEILSDVTTEMEEITEDTEGWMYGYFLMAYHPLSDAELDLYLAFAQTQAGVALNTALFAGFGKAYEDISYGLGRTIALNMVSEEL